MHDESFPINVDPGTPLLHASTISEAVEYSSDSSPSQDWSPLAVDDTLKGRLSVQTPPFYDHNSQSPYLSSPLSSTSSLPSLSPLAGMLNDFSLGDQFTGNGDEFQLEELWSPEQETLSASFSNVSRTHSSENLRLMIPTDSKDEVFSPASSLGSFNGSGLEATVTMFTQSDIDGLRQNVVYSQHSDNYPFSPSNGWLSPLQQVPQEALPRRHSFSTLSPPGNLTANDVRPTPYPLSPTSLGKGNISQHRYSLSDGGSSVSYTSHGESALSPTTLLTPDYLPDDHMLLCRHRDSNGNVLKPSSDDVPTLRRTRSLNNNLQAGSSQSGAADYPRTDRLWRSNRSPQSATSPLPAEDVFRPYDSGTSVGYPILQRDTIASDAVLRASAQRRKKIPTYSCSKCGQLLTSKDNLNNHQDAHEGIRRHRCEYCHERFRTRSVLKRHQKSAKCPGSRFVSKKS